VFDDKENCHQEGNKKRVFEDDEFSQLDVTKTDDDDSWLKRNDSFVPMSGVMQPTNSYVCNPIVSPGEIPNVRKYFRTPTKRIRGANANNVGKLSLLISFCISVFINFLQHIMFYSSKSDSQSRHTITYADVIECSPECTGRSVVDDPLSDLGLW
jgi:hypothetical protein